MSADAPDPRLRATRPVPSEIAVAIPHLRLVLDVLGRHAVEPRRKDRHERLGLARVRIRDTSEAAALFAAQYAASDRSPWSADVQSEPTDLDIVVAGLRQHFTDRWAGWTPTFGKNRSLVGGEGTPAVKHTSDDSAPVPVDSAPSPYRGRKADDLGHGGKGVAVGLLDTPLAPGLDLDGALVLSSDDVLATDENARAFRTGHGTFLAGLVHRYAPDARILPHPVLLDDDATTTAWDLAVALLALATAPAGDARQPTVDVVVMSLGCFTRDSRPPLVLKTAVDMVRDDVLLLAAGGNYADMTIDDTRVTGVTRQTPMWPAALDGVTAVGSHGRASTSRFSPSVPWIDLTAPGEQVPSTYFDGPVLLPGDQPGTTRTEKFHGFATWSGSSMSTAIAAGRLAVRRAGDEPLRATLQRRSAI